MGAKSPHRRGLWGAKPPPRRGLVAKPPSLGNFCSYIAYVPHPKPSIPQRVPSRLFSVLSDFDSPHLKPPVPTCGPLSLSDGNNGFPHLFIGTGAYNKVVFIDNLGFK